jgi:hypothetical protein
MTTQITPEAPHLDEVSSRRRHPNPQTSTIPDALSPTTDPSTASGERTPRATPDRRSNLGGCPRGSVLVNEMHTSTTTAGTRPKLPAPRLAWDPEYKQGSGGAMPSRAPKIARDSQPCNSARSRLSIRGFGARDNER